MSPQVLTFATTPSYISLIMSITNTRELRKKFKWENHSAFTKSEILQWVLNAVLQVQFSSALPLQRKKKLAIILEDCWCRLGWMRFSYLNQLEILTPWTAFAIINWSGFASLENVLVGEDNRFDPQLSTHILGCCSRLIFGVVGWDQIKEFCDLEICQVSRSRRG